jgi:hypothetical protein
MHKRCFKCGLTKARTEFYAHPKMADRLLGKCKECTKSDVAAHREANLESVRAYDLQRAKTPHRKAWLQEHRRTPKHKAWRREYHKTPQYKAWRSQYMKVFLQKDVEQFKRMARIMVGNAIRDQRLLCEPCEICGSLDRVEAHHDDYSRPLDIRWLCFAHHREVHGQVAASL